MKRSSDDQGGTPAVDTSLITSTTRKRSRGNKVVPLVRSPHQQPASVVDLATGLADAGVCRVSVKQQRGGAAVRPCPGSTSSSSTISQSLVDGDEEELFSPAFHALPEDHSHLDVHDAPAAMARRRVHEADENAEPPCVSTSSTCTSLGGRGHASGVGADDGVVQAAVLQHEDDVLHGGQELDEEDDEGVFDPFAFIKNLPPLPECVSRHRRVLLPRYRQTRRSKQKTLVLDLDETLVHSSLDTAGQADFSFPVTISNNTHVVNVRMRPYLREFLEVVSTMYEVVIFTASQRVYAEQLLNIIDNNKQLIRHRLYRDSCVYVDGNYLKDLTVLGRDLQHTIIVDNSPQAFGFQLSNGIPIESWYDNDDDRELVHLLEFLKHLAAADDVRPVICQTFKLQELVEAA